MGVIDFAQYLQTALNPGTQIEGNVVRVLADNGTEVGEAIFKTIEGGNGTAAEVGIGVQAAGTGGITTGLAFLKLNVGTVGAAIAPTLGILAGVGLYNLAPSFWDGVADDLYEHGKTIGGRVIAYWNGQNLYLDEETIEIFKSNLLKAGTYDVGVQADDDDFTDIPELHMPFVASAPVAKVPYIGTDEVEHELSIPGYQNHDAIAFFRVSDVFPQEPHLRYVFASATTGSDVYTHKNKVVHWGVGNTSASGGVQAITYGPPVNNSTRLSLPDRHAQQTAWLMLYGSEVVNPDLDPDATYPETGVPFPETYPGWIPYEYPLELPDPEILPNTYPIKYPGTDPDPYPSQQPAQNPQPEPAPEIYPEILPGFDLPEPQPGPSPSPEVDPDPQPTPDPIPEDDPVNPGKDPVDPNPGPGTSPIIPVAPLPATVNSSKLFTVYNPTSSQLDSLGGYLWDSSIIAAIRDIWQEPMDGLISLQQVYVTPVTGGSHNIILGFLDSGVSSAVVSQQFVDVNCGTVTVPENKQNATDYAPYTSLHLYLPFIGIVELDTNECMNSSITVKYKVDVYTGTCLAQISISRNTDMPNDPILYTFSGNCSQQLPLTSGNATGVLGALVGAVTAGISVASGGGLSTLAGAQLLGNSLTHEMMHVSHSGNISANAGIMGQKKPYLIIGRRHGYDANNYNAYYGFPANKTVILGNHTGFVRVKDCHVKTKATQPEFEEITRLLKEGVFV